MLSFFFNRKSKVVLLMEAIGVALMIFVSLRIFSTCGHSLTKILLVLVLMEYAFLRTCAGIRWYRNSARFSGIELQFKKALVPTSYILSVAGFCLLVGPSVVVLSFSFVLISVVAHVNVILIYFHIKDDDQTPSNFFSSGRFLFEAAPNE